MTKSSPARDPESDERTALIRENRLLRSVLSCLPLQIKVLDDSGQAIFRNDRTESGGTASGTRALARSESTRMVGPDNSRRWLKETRIRLPQEGDENQQLLLQEDITEFKRAENAVKIRENRIKAILDTAVEGIVTINERGLIETFNPAAAHIFGYTTSEVVGQNVKILMPEPYHSEHDQYIQRFLETGAAKIIGAGREVRGRRKNGEVFPMQLSVGVVFLKPGMLFTGIIRDLSDFKAMQEEVARAQHLAMIGEMCASIAHEIRNPLAGISGAMQVICRETKPEDPRREILTEIGDQVTRLSRSVNDLLLFTKQWSPEKQMWRLGEVVRKVCRTAKMEKGFEAVEFDIAEALEDANALIDPKLVEQILWNLLQNARDACDSRGTIHLDYGETADYNQLIVRDTGCGIEPKNLENVFKPFFTTKTRGTGLGLPITKQIMNAHGGKVSMRSEIGEGTEITLSFPNLKPALA